MRWLLPLTLLSLFACGGEESNNCWYCDSGGPVGSATGTTTGKGTVGTKSTTSTKDGEGTTSKAYWYGAIDTATGAGQGYGYESAGCQVRYEMLSVSVQTDCADCVFAYSFTLGDAQVVVDASCTDEDTHAGEQWFVGHGTGGELWMGGASWSVDVYGYSIPEGTLWNFYPGSK